MYPLSYLPSGARSELRLGSSNSARHLGVELTKQLKVLNVADFMFPSLALP